MGTDIHMYAEVREGALWRPAYEPEPSKWSVGGKEYPRVYRERNYDLFAILADVRNGLGFAGIPTGRGYEPVAEQRGLPDDMCDEYRNAGYLAWLGDHSWSWLTLAELLDYDWAQESIRAGVVNAANYFRFRDYIEEYQPYASPTYFAAAVAGGSVKNVPFAEMDRLLAAVRKRITRENRSARPHEVEQLFRAAVGRATDPFGDSDSKAPELRNVYTRIEWPVIYSLQAGTFYTITMPKLGRVARERAIQPSDVRLVFGFDS